MDQKTAQRYAARAYTSSLGLGCASAWGQQWYPERKAIAIVHRALELGITTFDTGPTYSGGTAEPRLGRAMAGKDLSGMLVSTKVGTHLGTNQRLYKDWSPAAIERSLASSRKNLGLDCMPLLYLHGPRPETFTNELLDTLGAARNRGHVRWLGVNSFDDDVLEMLVDIPDFDVIMLDYNLIRRHREQIIERLHGAGKVIVAGAALANHLLAPNFLVPRSKTDAWYLLRMLKNYRGDYLRARRLSFIIRETGFAPAQAALAYIAANPHVATAMFSTTNIVHLEENAAARGMHLPEPILKRIRLMA